MKANITKFNACYVYISTSNLILEISPKECVSIRLGSMRLAFKLKSLITDLLIVDNL